MQVIHENTDYQLLFIEYWLRAARNPQIRARFVKHRRALVEQTTIDPAVLAWTGLSPEALVTLLVALNHGFAIEVTSPPGPCSRTYSGRPGVVINRRH